MTMVYLIAGVVAGIFIGYILVRLLVLKDYVSKSLFEHQQSELVKTKESAAAKMSREELAQNYVVREQYTSLQQQLEDTRNDIKLQYVPRDSYTALSERLLKAENELKEKETIILDLSRQLENLQSKEEHLQEHIRHFKGELEELHKRSKEEFANLANGILEEKKKLFVESNKTELQHILSPLRTDLDTFKKTVEETRKEDIRDLTSLKKELDSLHQLNVQLSEDARNLATALKSDTRVQGTWGEDRLKLILESEGLQRHIDYKDQEAYYDEEQDRQRRPDMILNLPNNKHIIIDSKVSLTAYINYCNAQSPDEKRQYLKQHLKSITDHIDLLAAKNYHLLNGLNAPDYVFMFMPIETAVTLALNENPDIFNRALAKKIVIITPTTLVATLKVVKIIWQKEKQVANVQEIFKQCGLLYDKFVLFLEEMEKLGGGLHQAQKSYKEAMDRLKEGTRKGDTIIGRFETIKNLEARTNKSIPQKYITEIGLPDEQRSEDSTLTDFN